MGAPLRICYLADGRAPIPRTWVGHFVNRGYDVHLISSYPCDPSALPDATVYQVPIAFSGLAPTVAAPGVSANGFQGRRAALRASLVAALKQGASSDAGLVARNLLSCLDVYRHIASVRSLIEAIQPDLVHAMRIPFEAIVAALATPAEMPLLVSVWGNDFTMFADLNPLMRRLTKRTMRRADGLHADCHRDIRLARTWQLDPETPVSVFPGIGGIDQRLFRPGAPDTTLRDRWAIPPDARVLINPRGIRGYIRTDVFFRAVDRVVAAEPRALVLCSAMAEHPIAERWVRRLGLAAHVRLLPSVPRARMPDYFRLAEVVVSPSRHDGTPNSLLEAMACGCFPVAGDIESVREWIDDGDNGLLCDPTDHVSLARALLRALRDNELRARACGRNLQLIAAQADYDHGMRRAEDIYHETVARKAARPG